MSPARPGGSPSSTAASTKAKACRGRCTSTRATHWSSLRQAARPRPAATATSPPWRPTPRSPQPPLYPPFRRVAESSVDTPDDKQAVEEYLRELGATDDELTDAERTK